MDVLFALHHAGAFRSYDSVVRALDAAGHRVRIHVGADDKVAAVDEGLRACERECDSVGIEPLLSRRRWRRLAGVRDLLNCAIFLHPEHPSPGLYRRFRHDVPWPWVRISRSRKLLRLAGRPGFRRLLGLLEPAIPIDAGLRDWLEANRPDVLFASPYILPGSAELDYVKAARALGIPTVVSVLSWDNLTTKGTFHVLPDHVLVWNEPIRQEAVRIHGVPDERITTTGAPTFDFWFDMEPADDRAAFCRRVGLPPEHPYVLYICSSVFIAGDETGLVRELVRTLRDRAGRPVGVLVRPHPLNAEHWERFEEEGVAVWPRAGAWVDRPDAKREFYDSIHHAAAAIGVNTSAFLDCAILDTPCVALLAERYQEKQTELGHFHHLIDGDFLDLANGCAEAATRLSEIVNGRDGRREGRRRFVRDFIRPHGLDRAVSPLLAEAVLAVGRGDDPAEAIRRATSGTAAGS
jgi:hypothetical protein